MDSDSQPYTPPPITPDNQPIDGRFSDVTNGNPQYSPPTQQVPVVPDTMPRVVHITRAAEPHAPELSEETKLRHQRSVEAYPYLNISDAEYVIADVKRHPVGMAVPIASAIVVIFVVALIVAMYQPLTEQAGTVGAPGIGFIALIGGVVCLFTALFAYISVWVFRANRFYLTNESVIQEIQESLFSKREQTINLGNIEDASYSQHGPLQLLFDYGSIRLSTEGEETTYRMNYVAHPKEQIAKLTNAVEAFKNGRPIES